MNGVSLLDMFLAITDSPTITREEFTKIRHTNDPDKIKDAVMRMEAAGGYENLV